MVISDAMVQAIVAGLPPTIAALGAIWIGWRNSVKNDVIATHVAAVDTKVDAVQKATDGMSSALQAAALEKGKKIGGDDQRLIAAEQKSAIADAVLTERSRADAAAASAPAAVAINGASGARQGRASDNPAAPVTPAPMNPETGLIPAAEVVQSTKEPK